MLPFHIFSNWTIETIFFVFTQEKTFLLPSITQSHLVFVRTMKKKARAHKKDVETERIWIFHNNCFLVLEILPFFSSSESNLWINEIMKILIWSWATLEMTVVRNGKLIGNIPSTEELQNNKASEKAKRLLSKPQIWSMWIEMVATKGSKDCFFKEQGKWKLIN